MKLEAVTPVEDSKMDSKKTSSDQPTESTENGVNGNGVENGDSNGGAPDGKVSQNGNADVKLTLESDEQQADAEEKADLISSPVRATHSASKPESNSDGEVIVSPGVASLDCNDTPDRKNMLSNSSGETSEPLDAESMEDDVDSKNISLEKELISDSARNDTCVESKNSPSETEAMPKSKDTVVDSEDIPSDNAGTSEIKDASLDSKISESEPMDTEESEQLDKQVLVDEKQVDSVTCQQNVENETDNEKNINAVGEHSHDSSDGSAVEKDTNADTSNVLGNEQPKTVSESTDCVRAPISCLDKNAKETDPDLEKVKSGGLTLKLDSGEEFSVQLADEEEEEEAKSHCKTPVANDSDDDVTVVRVETKPKPKAEIHVTYGGAAGSSVSTQGRAPTGVAQTLPMMTSANCTFLTSSAPVVTGATGLIPSGGNIFVPVQFPPTSVLKSGQMSVPVLLNTQTGGFVKNMGQNVTVKSVASNHKPAAAVQVATATVDPVAAANYAKAKELHAKKVEDYKELSSFLTSMRNKVTVKNTVDALRDHVVKIPEYRRLEAAKKKALAWKMETDEASVSSEKESDDTDREKSVTPVSKDEDSKDGRESETTEVEEKTGDDDEATDVEMKDKTDDDEATDVEMKDEVKDEEAGEKSETAESSDLGKDGKEKEEKRGDDVKIKSVEDEKVVDKNTEEGKEKSEEVSKPDENKDVAKTTDADETEVKTDEAKVKDTTVTKDDGKTIADEKPAAETVAEPAIPEQASEKGDHEEAAKKLRPVARFLYYSGLDLAREYIYKDLLDKQEVLIDKNKLSFEEEEDFHRLRRIYSSYRRKNKPMHPKVKKCRSCNFQTESKNAMHNHQEYGHVDLSVGRYECALCDFDTRAASAFKFHMEAEHSMVGRVTVKPCFWHCDLCPYEHNNKAMVIKHKMKCGKKFDIKKHLFPTYDDINFLFRALPGPSIGANPALTPPAAPKPGGSAWSTVGPKTVYSKPYNSLPTSYASVASTKPQVPQIVTYMTSNGPVRVQLNQSQPRPQLPTMSASKPALIQHLTTPAGITPTPTLLTTSTQGVKRPAAPTLAATPAKVARSELEICEICGGFIKDRQSLRLHFKMAHCIEIDEAVITTKHTAPLSCDVCMKRFWTFQGLTMHRVALNHIPSTNTKSMRGSKCFICSVFVADIMKHINSTHNMIPGQLNTIRICPVCGHNMTPGHLVSHLKLLHNMILPLPGSVANQPTSVATSSDQNKVYTCPSCKRSFISIQTLNKHIDQAHSYKCHLCDFRCTSIDVYKNHITQGHKKVAKKCNICKKSFIGAAYTVHVQKEHCRKFSIKVERCDHLVDLFKGSSGTNEKSDKAAAKTVKAEPVGKN